MIALQILLCVTAVLGMLLCLLEFRRARGAYTAWRDGGQNGLTLQVCAHQVRIAVTNVVIHAVMLLSAILVLMIMWTGRCADQLDLVMVVSLSTLSLLLMLKQSMYRYDYALIMDHAMVTTRPTEKAAP